MALMTESRMHPTQAEHAPHPDAASDGPTRPGIRSAEPVRWNKVLKARQQLAAEVYEDPTVLDFAVDKLLKALNSK